MKCSWCKHRMTGTRDTGYYCTYCGLMVSLNSPKWEEKYGNLAIVKVVQTVKIFRVK